MNCENGSDENFIVNVYSLRTCWSGSNSKIIRETKELGIEAEKMQCTLEKWLKEKNEKGEYDLSLVCQVIKRTIAIIKFLHDNHYLHNDIAVRNFLVGSDGTIKISDFGLSRKLKASSVVIEDKNQDFEGYRNSNSSDDQLDQETSYSEYYLDKSEQDQPYWWCAPEVLKSLIDSKRVDKIDIRYDKNATDYATITKTKEQIKQNKRPSPLLLSYKTDNYMIGCLILELILSKNGSSSQNGVDFIPFSVDCSNCQSIYLKDIFLHKDQALKMEQCYELRNKNLTWRSTRIF